MSKKRKRWGGRRANRGTPRNVWRRILEMWGLAHNESARLESSMVKLEATLTGAYALEWLEAPR